jgi:hypothetical protein
MIAVDFNERAYRALPHTKTKFKNQPVGFGVVWGSGPSRGIVVLQRAKQRARVRVNVRGKNR